MKYFPKIAVDVEGKMQDCNVQTPLTQLKLKGNKGNAKDQRSSKAQAEVPHGGIWVKRASTRMENMTPKVGVESFYNNQTSKNTMEDDFYATEYNLKFNATDNFTSTRYNSIEPAGSRVPNSYKLTTTEKLPLVRKELIKQGKTRGEVEQRVAEKLETHQ